MTNTRTTERLLEVIEESVQAVSYEFESPGQPVSHGLTIALNTIEEALAELRRRGDTLVRRGDLEMCLDHDLDWVIGPGAGNVNPNLVDAWQRIQTALGGKP